MCVCGCMHTFAGVRGCVLGACVWGCAGCVCMGTYVVSVFGDI